MIAISKPLMGAEEKRAVAEVLDSGVLAQGPRVAQFERAFAEFIGVKHAIATASGTAALHAAVLAHGIGPGDEVITTPFTFIASVNAILYIGARPVLVDIDESFNIASSLVEEAITPRTKAIMPVHLYGQPADMAAIGRIVRKYGLALIEDACQAHGAAYAGRRVGSFGTGCFSFYATKNMTTGEGGMLTTDSDEVAERARLAISHGMRVRYHHDTLGYNYRMSEIAAAIGIEQLKRLPAFNARRAEIARFYDQALEDLPGLVLPRVYPHRTHVYHQYTIRVTPAFGIGRDEVAKLLREKGITTGIYYPIPVHQQKSMERLGLGELSLPVAERMAREVLSLPGHTALTQEELDYIVKAVRGLGFPRREPVLADSALPG